MARKVKVDVGSGNIFACHLGLRDPEPIFQGTNRLPEPIGSPTERKLYAEAKAGKAHGHYATRVSRNVQELPLSAILGGPLSMGILLDQL